MRRKPIRHPQVKLYSHTEYAAASATARLGEIRKRGVIAIGDGGEVEIYLVSAQLWQPVNVEADGVLKLKHRGRYVAYGLPPALWNSSLLLTECFTRAALRRFRKLPK